MATFAAGSLAMMSRSFFATTGVGVMALVLNACASVPWDGPINLGRTETGPGSLAAARKSLEGRWTLVSYDVYPADGPPITLKGSGTLTFDEFANLTIDIRADQESAAILERAGIDTTNGALLTSGRTVVDLEARTLTYVLEGQPLFGAPSGPLVLNRPRYWDVDGNLLTLTIKGDEGRPLSVGRWQKPQ
jgi:hypothetical protein